MNITKNLYILAFVILTTFTLSIRESYANDCLKGFYQLNPTQKLNIVDTPNAAFKESLSDYGTELRDGIISSYGDLALLGGKLEANWEDLSNQDRENWHEEMLRRVFREYSEYSGRKLPSEVAMNTKVAQYDTNGMTLMVKGIFEANDYTFESDLLKTEERENLDLVLEAFNSNETNSVLISSHFVLPLDERGQNLRFFTLINLETMDFMVLYTLQGFM